MLLNQSLSPEQWDDMDFPPAKGYHFTTMLTVLALVTTLLYFAAATLQGLRMANKARNWNKAAFFLSFIAILLHAFLLHNWIDVSTGQNLTFFNTLSQVFWIATAVVWLMALRRPVVNLGVVLYPLAGVSILLVLAFSGTYIINTGAEPKKLLHILLSFLALSILIIAALQAIFLAILDRALRKKYSNPLIESLPPLQKMESLLFQLIALGFIVLATVIITGIYFYPHMFASNLWHHMLLATAAWVVFAILLLGRLFFGWRGRVAIRWCLVGVALLIIAYITSHFWSM